MHAVTHTDNRTQHISDKNELGPQITYWGDPTSIVIKTERDHWTVEYGHKQFFFPRQSQLAVVSNMIDSGNKAL